MENIVLDLFQRVGAKEIKEEEVPEYNELVNSLVEFSEKARREGLLSLEVGSAKVPHLFLRIGLILAIDGTDASTISDILCAYIIADNYRDFMKRILMLQGVISICNEENPRLLEQRLHSFLGLDWQFPSRR